MLSVATVVGSHQRVYSQPRNFAISSAGLSLCRVFLAALLCCMEAAARHVRADVIAGPV